jgi:hypothetical protein
MGIHVSRSSRGTAAVLFARRPGEKTRPQTRRPGKTTAASGGARPSVKSGGGSGTSGNFGADFE